jgi:hypothetical protein
VAAVGEEHGAVLELAVERDVALVVRVVILEVAHRIGGGRCLAGDDEGGREGRKGGEGEGKDGECGVHGR